MNILHLTPDFNYVDGRSYYVYLLLKYLKRRGHNVFLYTNGGDSLDRIEELNISAQTDQRLSSKSSFLLSVNKISEFTKKNNIDIIHSHHRYYELIANAAAAMHRSKLKTVFTALSIVDKRYMVEYKSGKIIAVSNSVRKMLTDKFKVRKDKIVLIPNFADSEEEINLPNDDKTENKMADGKINLLSAGRFHKEKDQMTLLKALTILKNNRIHLKLIGEGPERETYERFIKKNSLNVNLITPQKDLKEFFQKADICVLPSIRDPFPGFMLQSGLHKKPFVGSDVDGISELIINNVNGLLFKKQDPADLSEKITKFIKDIALSEKCGKNLHTIVKKKYTEKTIIPMVEKVYYSLR